MTPDIDMADEGAYKQQSPKYAEQWSHCEDSPSYSISLSVGHVAATPLERQRLALLYAEYGSGTRKTQYFKGSKLISTNAGSY